MNQDYVSNLERILHNSKYGLVQADKQIKDLSKKQKKLQDALLVVKKDNDILNRKLEYEKEKYRCYVCFQNMKDCIIEPCRHFAGCISCCSQLSHCPICRSDIKSYITLFIP